MAGAPHLFLLPLLLLSQARDASPGISFCTPIMVIGTLGKSVMLPFEYKGTFKRITWSTCCSGQAAASDRSEPLAVFTPGEPGVLQQLAVENERYRGRVRLHSPTYSLEISNLTMADQVGYSLEAKLGGPSVYRCDYTLSIYQQLSEPEISVCPVMSGNSTCNVTFTCSAGERTWFINYTWTRPAGGAVLSTEESLLVQHRLGDEDSPVTCTARNLISNSSASASPKAACEGPTPPQTPALSYCHAKGILLLGVLGTLLAAILTMHVLAVRGQRQP
ncbi:SLAM family member 9-like [Emydura macquarii macquarii]|uniref:SLAM family member 9-like n=1 Tax=Emydura macquarii macquarii TaxID=1129001 RepID=UPI00352ACBA6